MFVTQTPGAFCWLDLAASDADRAKRFYAQAFGWTFREQPALGGHFTRCRVGDREVGSLYQLPHRQLARGVPSHWTPYIGVADLEAALQDVVAAGGRIVVAQLEVPLDAPEGARIALIEDAVGAFVGLWQSISPTAPTAAGG